MLEKREDFSGVVTMIHLDKLEDKDVDYDTDIDCKDTSKVQPMVGAKWGRGVNCAANQGAWQGLCLVSSV
ncbi:hypothetical protein ACOSQ4_000167 [Xanthoceras sorbifolium]